MRTPYHTRCSIFQFIFAVVFGLHPMSACGQSMAMDQECFDMLAKAKTLEISGGSAKAESLLAEAVAAGKASEHNICSALTFTGFANMLAINGKWQQAEIAANRALRLFDGIVPRHDEIRLDPMLVLMNAQIELGKGGLRPILAEMREVDARSPRARAVLHCAVANFMQSEKRWDEAEQALLAAATGWDEVGLAGSALHASTVLQLAAVYLKAGRTDDARRTLDQAESAFKSAPDTVPQDRMQILLLHSALDFRDGNWQLAECHLGQLIQIADMGAYILPAQLDQALVQYEQVLRRLHRNREAKAVRVREAALRASLPPTELTVDASDLAASLRSKK